mgnify:CR=1 FL=1
MNDKKTRVKIKKLKSLLKKNAENVKKIVVSEILMKQLAQFPGEVEIESKMIEKFSQHDFIDHHKTYEDEEEVWFLFGIEAEMSSLITRGAVLEMKDGQFVILSGI